MTNIQYYKSYAKRLYDNNFFPIPIVPGEKRPAIKEWSKINELDEDSYKKILNRYDDHGIGILLGNICAIDIDILDKKLSFKVTEFIKNFLGEAPTRIGQYPKSALFYRVLGKKFNKTSTKICTSGDQKSQVEFLASGNQIVIAGIHQKTGKPYQWVDENLIDMDFEELPTIDINQRDFLKTKIEQLIFSHYGITYQKPKLKIIEGKKSINKHYDDSYLKQVEDAIKVFDPQDRETWVSVGHALKADFNENGLKIFLHWSKRRPDGSIPSNYINDEDVMITWKSFKPNKTSIKSLLTKAKAKGWDGDSDLIILRGSHTEIAKYIKSNIELSGPQLVYDEGSFWQYKNTHWEKCEDHLCRKWVQDLDGLPIDKKKVITANKSLIDGALNELAAICNQPYFFQECKIGINCLSGFIHITDKSNIELLDHAPEHRQRHTIEAKWSPNNKKLIGGYLKMFLEGCFKDESDKNGIIKLLFQILGVGCCNYSTKLSSPKAFVLFGPTAMNGKSQFLNLFKAFLPVSSYASIPPSSFKQEQYLADLVGKSINVTDELSGTKAIVSDKMKSVITGDMISAKKIYQPVFNFRPLALHIFASNELPNFEGGVDAGIERRLKVIPFKRSIPKEEQIPQIAEKIVNDESDVLLYLAVNGLKEVIEKGDYEIPNVVDSETKEWFKLADVILEWFNEGELDNKIISKKRYHFKTAYQDFIEWMKRRNHCAFYPTNQRFNSRIRALANHSKYIVAKDSKGFYVTENILL